MKFSVVLVGIQNKKEVVHFKSCYMSHKFCNLAPGICLLPQSDWFKEHYEAVTIQPFLSLTFARKVK